MSYEILVPMLSPNILLGNMSSLHSGIEQLEAKVKDPHQPYPDVYLSEEQMNIEDVERMEGEGRAVSFEGDLGPVTPKAHENVLQVSTPRTQPPDEERHGDETVEGGEEDVISTVRGCNCSCPRCPEECPPSCECAGHLRHELYPTVLGDEP